MPEASAESRELQELRAQLDEKTEEVESIPAVTAQARAAWCSVIAILRELGSSNLLEDLQACLRSGWLPRQESPALG